MFIRVLVVIWLCLTFLITLIESLFLIPQIRSLRIENDDLLVRLRLADRQIDHYEHVIKNLKRRLNYRY